ncbi:MAG: hypothetical protein H6512_12325 [Acidimicrobiia bacterium]|nr:hypothetical protein [Acidimicrobiia bacterium]
MTPAAGWRRRLVLPTGELSGSDRIHQHWLRRKRRQQRQRRKRKCVDHPSGGCEADLTTTKTVDYPKRTRDGGGNTTGTATSTYTIKVSNVSPSTNNPTGTDPDGYTFNGAKNIVVVDTYPDGFTPTEYPSDCVVNSTARTITCTRTANLAAGANYAFDIKGPGTTRSPRTLMAQSRPTWSM